MPVLQIALGPVSEWPIGPAAVPDLSDATFAKLGGDAVMGDYELRGHLAGSLRRSSSKKLNNTVTCGEALSPVAASGSGKTANRLPSGARS